MKRFTYHIFLFLLVCFQFSCFHSKKFTQNYYREHRATFQSIYEQYKNIYAKSPFSLQISHKPFDHTSLEILTDTIRYIYDFNINDNTIQDTLQKYHFDIKAMNQLMNDMQELQCTWITKLDYYEREQKKYLVFISVRHKNLEGFLKKAKYFTLAFFEQPQLSDKKGRLKDKTDGKQLRKINDAVFRKITDKVFYAFSLHFR